MKISLNVNADFFDLIVSRGTLIIEEMLGLTELFDMNDIDKVNKKR